jgi:4,5-DOPA dioxygenase extradiol
MKNFQLSPVVIIFLSIINMDSTLKSISQTFANTEKMPVLFLGHGSPMNAIEENEFVTGFRNIGKNLPKPSAVLCISAHWETHGTKVTAMEHPKTIHDFGGFPRALFEVQYPAPGSPELAREIKTKVRKTNIETDETWGLDHGAWSVIKHLFPAADVPVIQLSLDRTKPAKYHFELARELAWLRNKGVLIIGSGNMIHNLGMVAWNKMNVDNFAYEWTTEASTKMKAFIDKREYEKLVNYSSQGIAFEKAIPTPEHFLPLLYVLALQEENENTHIFNDKAVAGSLTMTSVKVS